ncbi:hypothetical protein SESBI_13769 [Sesbania bispinosa]|nr:hypothetical protein SESBI_13769 [Sesbania bispinosa]
MAMEWYCDSTARCDASIRRGASIFSPPIFCFPTLMVATVQSGRETEHRGHGGAPRRRYIVPSAVGFMRANRKLPREKKSFTSSDRE